MRTTLFAMLVALTAWPLTASAEDVERFGEVHFALKNAEYASVTLNGNEWDAIEFERNGKLLLVKNLPLADAPFEIGVKPSDSKLASETFKLEEADFKKKRKGRMYILVAKRSLKFKVVKSDVPEPVPPKEEPPKPTEAPDEDDEEL